MKQASLMANKHPVSAGLKRAEIRTNLQGQALGRKGLESRQRLMQAARRMLESHSPVELTAVSIAKVAKTSSASFYMYFQDIRDVLYALSEVASADMIEVIRIVEEPWEAQDLREHALRLVETLNSIWDRHREVLRIRNLEADRGDPRFEALRMNTYIPFIDQLGRRIQAACPPDKPKPSLGEAFALASVLHSAMERLASTDPAVVARGVGAKKLNEAIAHVIMLVFSNGAPQPEAADLRRRVSKNGNGQELLAARASRPSATTLAEKPATRRKKIKAS